MKWFDQWLIVQRPVGLRSGRLLKGMKTPISSRAKWFYQHLFVVDGGFFKSNRLMSWRVSQWLRKEVQCGTGPCRAA